MEKIQEITECCICKDIFTDPRILTCIHTFCFKCLEETASKTGLNPRDTMPCPICRKSFVIPDKGIVGLQKNFFMERLMEISKLSQPSSSAAFCEVCKTNKHETNTVPTAIQFCVQCKKNICDRCCEDHTRFQELQRHEFIPIGSPLKDVLMRNVSLQFCEQHNNKELEMYCLDCRQVICVKCFAQNHKSHNCSDIDEVADKLREQIRCDIGTMNNYEAEADAKVEKIVKSKANFQKKVEDTERAIIQRGIELKELVDLHTSSKLNDLSLIKQGVTKEMAIQQEEIETHKIIVKSFDKYCMELSGKGTSAEICRAADQVHLRAEELKKNHRKEIHRQIPSTVVEFQTSDVDNFLKKENIVVTVRAPFRRKVKLKLPHECWVSGVTKQEKKIYVLCYKPNMIRVFYDQNPYNCAKDVEINQIKNPSNIESCVKSKSLYISDSKNSCAWRMNVSNNRMAKILTMAHCSEPFTMSITAEGHMMVVKRVQELNQLEIYGTDGKLVRSISLLNGIYWPQHAIQKPNGEFIVIHSLGESAFGPWAISRLTSDGQTVIAQFGSKNKEATLFELCRLVLDSSNDRLLVADCLNNRVVALDSLSLNPTKVLLTGVIRPTRLCYDKWNEQLIVGQDEGNIDIYEGVM